MPALFAKPFALSIGPQASGADLIRGYFKTRGDVVLPDVQEIFYFDRHVQRGPEFYRGHFQYREAARLFMEVTTTAFDHPQAPERVRALLGPDVKLFCPLRDPVERAAAAYRHYLRYGIVKGGIEEACEQAPQILHASRYSEHLGPWLDVFKTIHFIPYSALAERPADTLSDLCDFLDIPYSSPCLGAKIRSFLPQIWMPQRGKADPTPYLWLSAQLEGEAEATKILIKSVF